MFRITVDNQPDFTTVNLEGRLTSDWVASVLEACTSAKSDTQKVVVDLSDLCCVDFSGRRLLSDLHQRGVQLVGSGLVVRGLIEEITKCS